ncbi:unnamed protein product, partial [Closterium sp. NIES-54]
MPVYAAGLRVELIVDLVEDSWWLKTPMVDLSLCNYSSFIASSPSADKWTENASNTSSGCHVIPKPHLPPRHTHLHLSRHPPPSPSATSHPPASATSTNQPHVPRHTLLVRQVHQPAPRATSHPPASATSTNNQPHVPRHTLPPHASSPPTHLIRVASSRAAPVFPSKPP